MAKVFVTNLAGTGAACMYALKQLLATPVLSGGAGWTVTKSGTGTLGTFGNSDLITSAAVLANSNAWFVLQIPTANGVNRQLCIQRGSSNQAWRIKYSYSAGFTGGSPSATALPTATDEQYLYGDGTPTFTTLFGTDNTYWFHACADSSAPYGFWAAAYAQSGKAMQMGIYMDPVTGVTGDIDPYVFYCYGNGVPFALSSSASANANNMNGWTNAAVKAWLLKGTGSEGFVTVGVETPCLFATTSGMPTFSGALPMTPSGLDDTRPVTYARLLASAAPNGFKGISTMLRLYGPQRNTGDTQDSKAWIILGALALPWNSSTTPN